MTNLKYLDDTYLFTVEAEFQELRENERGQAVILDETIFYPQGGGQPADQGEITSTSAKFIVKDVRLDESGTVWHFGNFSLGEFKKDEKVKLEINKDRRLENARLHSAGHLIDCAIEQLKIEGLKPGKGFHFPEGPYVEYEGNIDNSNELMSALQSIVNDLVARDLVVEKNNLSQAEASRQGVWAPAGKSARIINFVGFSACGCGGTHVKSSAAIGKLLIRKIKSNNDKIRISYAIE